jgi:glycosyltransferase involved in cell wall biosynthesis
MTIPPKHKPRTDLATVVILTLNEEIHVSRAVENAKRLTDYVFIVDSGSTDRTCDLATACGAEVFPHAFENYGDQRQWALRELPYRNDWVFFLDADELLSDNLIEEIQEVIAQTPDDVDGYRMRRRFYWMGRWLRHGGLYPLWLLRIVRRQNAWCEDRTVNEHLLVSGLVKDLRNDILHIDLKPISDWLAKHNSYSSLEAREYLRQAQSGARTHSGRLMGSQAERKRWLRTRVVDRLVPPLIRPLFYFFYGYLFRFGFLDGKAGLFYHVLRSFSYRFMIEAKYWAIRGQGSEAVNPMPSGALDQLEDDRFQ